MRPFFFYLAGVCCVGFLFLSCTKTENLFFENWAKADHNILYSSPAGKEIPVTFAVISQEPVQEVRLYFRPMSRKYYFYVPMAEAAKGQYLARIPALRTMVKGIDYFICLKTASRLVRTKARRILILGNSSSKIAEEPAIVFAEEPLLQKDAADFVRPLVVKKGDLSGLKKALVFEEIPLQTTREYGASLPSSRGLSFSLQVGGFGIQLH